MSATVCVVSPQPYAAVAIVHVSAVALRLPAPAAAVTRYRVTANVPPAPCMAVGVNGDAKNKFFAVHLIGAGKLTMVPYGLTPVDPYGNPLTLRKLEAALMLATSKFG